MKILRKLCSEQVQILLERMDTHWEDEFIIKYDESKWEPMMPGGNAFAQYTPIEQFCIRHTYRVQTRAFQKELAYRGIMERVMSKAVSRSDFNQEKMSAYVKEAPPKIMTSSHLTDTLRYKATGRYAMGFTDPLMDPNR